MCGPALSPSVPTAVFLRLSPDPLPILSNPSQPPAQASPVACVLQVGVFKPLGPMPQRPYPHPNLFPAPLLPGALDSQGNKSGAVDVREEWCRAQGEWDVDPGRPWSPSLLSCCCCCVPPWGPLVAIPCSLYAPPPLVLQVLDTKISTEPQLGLETVGGWNIRR